MSFLTPLYIAGIAAVSLPILFHLIRRTPRGRLPFSALMFLQPSPPRVTRRSRIENWLLLLLRAAVLALLALAFGRPFLRETAATSRPEIEGRRTAVLIDTSASMRRGELWKQALDEARTIVGEAGPADRLALFTFDGEVTPVLGFDEWAELGPEARARAARERLDELSPGWSGTDLGEALTSTADILEERATHNRSTAKKHLAAASEIVLISDLQAGSRLNALQTSPWPEDAAVTLRSLSRDSPTNAGLHLAGTLQSLEHEAEIRVGVTNATDSARAAFRLQWKTAGGGTTSAEPAEVYVPAGHTRMVRVTVPAEGQDELRLTLSGDDHPFDNEITVLRPGRESVTVLYYGQGNADDPDRPRYYLERAFADSPRREVTVVPQTPEAPRLSPDADDVRLIVATEPLSPAHTEAVRRFVREGTTLLALPVSADACAWLGRLFGSGPLEAAEADVDEYAMLTDIDYEHLLFAPFSGPQYADFTQIHVWRHRRIDETAIPESRVLARFDDGDPALLEVPLEAGRVLILTTGWHPEDSQLALSSKFVPLLERVLDFGKRQYENGNRYVVGETIPVAGSKSQANASATVHRPDERTIKLASAETGFTQATVPGVYTIRTGEETRRISVQLDPEESRTSPLPVEKLEDLGVRLSRHRPLLSTDEKRRRERQLRARELESRQKLWRWLIVAALGLIVCETWQGRRTAGTSRESGVPSPEQTTIRPGEHTQGPAQEVQT